MRQTQELLERALNVTCGVAAETKTLHTPRELLFYLLPESKGFL